MQIVDSNYCFGPNIYTDRTAFWGIVDLGKLAGCYTEQLGPEFTDALFNLLPGIQSHSMEEGRSFTSMIKNREGVHVGRVIERIAIELQRLADLDVNWGTTILMEQPSFCKVVVECNDKVIYIFVLNFALFILNRLLPEALRDDIKLPIELPPGYDNRKYLQALVSTLRAKSLGITTNAIVEKAIQRKIPWQRLNTVFPFVQLGQGCYAKRVSTSCTSNDSPIRISNYKNVAVQFLAHIGLPVPNQAVVSKIRGAVAAAHYIGYPVVIKPVEGYKGKGVTTGITTDADAASAAQIALGYGGAAVVEKHIQGDDHRLLIVNGRLIAAAKRIPGHVIGDGMRSIQQLVHDVNRDPRRGRDSENLLVQLELDQRALTLLKKAGYTPQSVPRKDEIVYLRDTANVSTGGTAVDVTEHVHPDNRYIAETAVMQVGLAVAGVDFITPDISRSWKEVPGYIIEINAAPGFRPHWIADPGRDVVSPILDMLFPGDLPSSIPIAAITGSNGKTTTSQMLAHILRLSGKQCGLATTQGVFIDGRRIIRGDLAGVGGAHRIFLHKQVEVAVVESSRRGLLRSGLPFDFCDVGAVLNVTSEHVGTDGIESEDELARIKRLVAERSSQAVVLNAEDERCLAMAEHSPAQNLCLVATDKDNPHIQSHVDQGGHAVVLKESNGRMQIVLFGGNRWQSLIETADIAAGFKNLAFCNVTNAMFAAAIAWEMGISLDFISEGLRTFQSTFENNPGRLNVYDGLPFRVIVDFAHNAAKYKSLLEFVTSLPTKGRKIILITSSGNRVDSHFHEIAHACAGSFEHYFLAGADDLRGRGEFEIQEMIQAGLLSEGVSTNFITVCHRETEAIEKALSYAQEGDTLVLAVKNEVHCWQRITNYKI